MTSAKMQTEKHPLQPFLPKNARILMLGSFPPPKIRWSMEFFYPNWINKHTTLRMLLFFTYSTNSHISSRSSFVNSQEMLKYAINGMESKKQQYISHLTGVILAFLPALSVYSVFSDIYALITSNEQTIHFNNVSTLMLSAATVIMIAVLYLTTRKEK